MRIRLTDGHIRAIEAHGEATYPNEGAGFLLGHVADGAVVVADVLAVDNRREAEAQHNRYELSPQDFMRAEREAAQRDLSLVGIFHSHPDHPARPSQFDRDHALPNLSYLITSVVAGKAEGTHAWRLRDDRTSFDEDQLETIA
ncbi:MAG: M67 family metallopeptidase [Anaerolineae bacterium]|nr:M67 family metallopeptidase [Anaerolineae bacterium]